MTRESRPSGLTLAGVAFVLVLVFALGMAPASALWQQSIETNVTVTVPQPKRLESRV